ncbi:MAG: NOP5/NOP56 family protein [Thermoplasmatota archaeon]
MLLVTTWFGTFLLEGGRVVEQRPAPRDPRELARRLRRIDRGEILEEERELAELASGHRDRGEGPPESGERGGEAAAKTGEDGGPAAPSMRVEVREERLRSLGRLTAGRPPALDHLADRLGFGPSLLQEATLWMGREKLGELGPDRLVIQAVAGLEELTKTANLLTERLMEWYGFHFPELAESLGARDFVEAVAEHGGREAVERATGKRYESLGAPLSEADEAAVRAWASLVREVARCRSGLEAYITKRMAELAPNLSATVGPLLAARLISLTGGLDRLSRLPASTVQLLGAERALFQFMRRGGRPPKHGALFQHPVVHRAAPDLRGRVARALASSAALAARADAFGHRDISGAIRESLERKLERIQRSRPPSGLGGPRARGSGDSRSGSVAGKGRGRERDKKGKI